jgi:hypothetical protein
MAAGGSRYDIGNHLYATDCSSTTSLELGPEAALHAAGYSSSYGLARVR